MQELQRIRQAIQLLVEAEKELLQRTHEEANGVRNQLLDEQYRDTVRWKKSPPTYRLQGVVEYTHPQSETQPEFPHNPFPSREVFTREANQMTEMLSDLTERVNALLSSGETVTHVEVTYQAVDSGLDVEPVEEEK